MAASGAALMGIDLGTTGVKVGLFDADSGKALAISRREYQATSPTPRWLELDVETYWHATVEATRQAVGAADKPHVLAIGLSSQGQTFVPLDQRFRPLRPAIVWLDTRAEEQARQLRDSLDLEEYRRRTYYLFPSAIDSACKMLWLRQREPDVWARTRYLMLLPDYIGLRLTGERRIDINNAASTGMVDQAKGDWWPDALKAVGVPVEWLSPIGRPSEPVGVLTPGAAQQLGLQPGITVALGSNDQLNGAVGVGNVRDGMASATVGTALAVIATAENISPAVHPGVLRGPHPVPGLWYLLTYAKTTGVLLGWLRSLLTPHATYEALLAEAVQVPAGAEGIICLPHFSGTATPTFRSDVSGAFLGLTLGHTRAHLVRAVIEAVCFCARDALALAAQGTRRPDVLRMLGGATHSDVWMQIMADVLGLPLQIPACREAPVLGAAVFAGVAVRLFVSIEQCSETFYRTDRIYSPRDDFAVVYNAVYARYRDAMERLFSGALG
jgi:xylulokinase